MRLNIKPSEFFTREDLHQVLAIFSRTFASLADVFTTPCDPPAPVPAKLQNEVAVAFQGGPPPEGFRDEPGEQFDETAYSNPNRGHRAECGMTHDRATHLLTFLDSLGWDWGYGINPR